MLRRLINKIKLLIWHFGDDIDYDNTDINYKWGAIIDEGDYYMNLVDMGNYETLLFIDQNRYPGSDRMLMKKVGGGWGRINVK